MPGQSVIADRGLMEPGAVAPSAAFSFGQHSNRYQRAGTNLTLPETRPQAGF